MSRRFRSLPLVLFSAFAVWGVGGCGERASGESRAGAVATAAPDRTAGTACPTKDQVGEAAGFQVTMAGSHGSTPDSYLACMYEMTGRYRGNFLELTGEPAARADSVFADMKQAVRGMKGADAQLDRIDVGTQGWAFGSNSLSEAGAVIGSHVWRARLQYLLAGSIGDQKEAMVRVLQLVAR